MEMSGGEEAVLVAATMGDREDEEAGLLDVTAVEVRLFGEEGECLPQTSGSIHFFAMMRSLQNDTLLLSSTFASVATLAVQLTLLHSFVNAYFVGPALDGAWETWDATLSIPASQGGLSVKCATIAALIFSPIVLLAKIDKANEFGQTPIFRATMRGEVFYKDGSRACTTLIIYYFWSILYTLRAYIIIAYMTVVNAVVVVDTSTVRLIPVMVLVIAFLLDFDDYVLSVGFTERTTLGKVKPNKYCQIKMGRATAEACETIRRRTVGTIAIAQVAVMFTVKFHPFLWVLWAIPLIAMLLLGVQGSVFPKFEPPHLPKYLVFGTEPILLAICIAWGYWMRCSITPLCGEDAIKIY